MKAIRGAVLCLLSDSGAANFFGRTTMMGSWSLALDDEELRFPDLPDALFEFVQVGRIRFMTRYLNGLPG
jgi:hypothetical protein